MNVYLRYKDNLRTAECKRAVAFNEVEGKIRGRKIDPIEIWSAEKTGDVLFGMCTDVVKTGDNNIR